MFRKLDLLPSSGEVDETPILLGLLIQWLRLAISMWPNRVDVSDPSAEDVSRSSFWNVVFSAYLEFQMMDKVHKHNGWALCTIVRSLWIKVYLTDLYFMRKSRIAFNVTFIGVWYWRQHQIKCNNFRILAIQKGNFIYVHYLKKEKYFTDSFVPISTVDCILAVTLRRFILGKDGRGCVCVCVCVCACVCVCVCVFVCMCARKMRC
jgi:hypothetical protein